MSIPRSSHHSPDGMGGVARTAGRWRVSKGRWGEEAGGDWERASEGRGGTASGGGRGKAVSEGGRRN